MRLHADLRPVSVNGRRFKPEGQFRNHGKKEMSGRTERTGNRLLTARFFVGFNVGSSERWTEDDLIKFFIEIREEQGRSAGASFLTQRGIWQPLGGQRTPDEKGAQIVVINDDGIDERTFIDEMAALGEELTRKMEQDAIYLDIQKSGQVIEALTLTPE